MQASKIQKLKKMNQHQYNESILAKYGTVKAIPKEHQTESLINYLKMKEEKDLLKKEADQKWEDKKKETSNFFTNKD